MRARTWQKKALKFKFNVVKSGVDDNEITPLGRLGKPERAHGMLIAVDETFSQHKASRVDPKPR